MKFSTKFLLITLNSCLLLGGCTSVAPVELADPVAEKVEPASIEEKTSSASKPPLPIEYPVASFEDDSLYHLLVAEVAGYRRDYDTALEKYVEMADLTRDAGVAARATRLANYLKRNDMALKAAQIWSEAEPLNIDAHRHAADQLMRAGDLEAAIYHMEAVRNLGGLANFDIFAYRAASLDQESRSALLDAITNLLERRPDDEQLLFSKAVLLEQGGEFEGTLEIVNQLLKDQRMATKENTQLVALKANVLKSLHLSLIHI